MAGNRIVSAFFSEMEKNALNEKLLRRAFGKHLKATGLAHRLNQLSEKMLHEKGTGILGANSKIPHYLP